MQSLLSERIIQIMKEHKLRSVTFAKTLGISANYVSLLINGRKKKISVPLARLIESTYGYRAGWVLTGEGPIRNMDMLDRLQEDMVEKIRLMDGGELRAVAAYIKTLDDVHVDADLDKPSVLSAAEYKVYDLLTQGLGTRQIATKLELSLNTIKTHSRHIYKKLGVKSRSELVEWRGDTKK